MRFLILLSISVCSFLTAHTQVYRFRAIQSALVKAGAKEFTWDSDNSLLVQNMEDQTMRIFVHDKEEILPWVSKTVDEAADTLRWLKSRIKYTAIDKNGTKCSFQVDIMKDPPKEGYDVIFYFWYEKDIFVYRANLIE